MRNYTFFPCHANEVVLRVTSYYKGQLRGWLTNSRLNDPIDIQSVPHLLFSVDEFLIRENRMISHNGFESAAEKQDTCIATIRIRILFQEHHTWQGQLIWEDRQKETSFRSVWDLIQILDEILAR